MPPESKSGRSLLDLFKEQPCWMIEPLAAEMQYSTPSVRRFLTEAGYYSSFSHNGRWYTLQSIPRFNRDGLWFYRDIGFSRTGSLTNTLVDLTTSSATGMTAEQLGEKLQRRCHSVLIHLCRRGRLQRQKLGRSYVYLAAAQQTAAIQRQAMIRPDTPEIQLPAEIAVLILVEFIRSPQSSFAHLAKTISRGKNVTVEATQIERLFEQHGLKKTTRIAPPKPLRR
jgi:hypothetical protein